MFLKFINNSTIRLFNINKRSISSSALKYGLIKVELDFDVHEKLLKEEIKVNKKCQHVQQKKIK